MMPLRMRVRRSAMGSVMFLPARLDDAGDLALQRQVAETDAAHGELAHVRARAATDRAAVAVTHRGRVLALLVRELALAGDHLRKTCHVACPWPALRPEGHAEVTQ